MNMSHVYADFHNADEQDRLRLNCVGTVQDLSKQCITLQEDLQLIFYSEELEVNGQVQFSDEENIWVAVINWDSIREVEVPRPNEANSLTPFSKVPNKNLVGFGNLK